MSLDRGWQFISCDGANCEAVAPAPVALRPTLTGADAIPAAGWLFVVRQNISYHFCPACAQRQLASVRNNDPAGTNDMS